MFAEIAPSRIARYVAAKEWPEVQSQRKVARGVYRFSCAGHGGLVAVLPEAEAVIEHPLALRAFHAAGMVVEVGVIERGRSKQWFYGPEYTEASWTE